MYNVKDFDNLPWNPLKEKKGIENLWKPFLAYKEFGYPLRGLDKDFFFNYMCLVYHFKSVLVQDFESPKDRKYKALDLLEIPSKDGKYSQAIEKMLNHENTSADLMIIRFCSLQNNQRYTLYITLGISYDKLMKKMYEQIDGKDLFSSAKEINALNSSANNLLESIDKLKKELFYNDMEVANQSDEEILSYARVPGYPEMFAHGKLEL